MHNLEQDRLSVAVSSFVSLKVITAMSTRCGWSSPGGQSSRLRPYGKGNVRGPGDGLVGPPALRDALTREKVRVTGERSGPAFEIKYMDVSSTTVVFVEDGRIEFRDAQGLLQSVQADDVRQINRI
jgi:hypothetical protein